MSLMKPLAIRLGRQTTPAKSLVMPRYAAYKSSGVEWLGKIPASWQPIKLKRLANIQNGKDYKHIETDGDGYPVIGSGGKFANASEYLFKGESVLLGRKGTIDRPLYINGAFWVVDTTFYTKIASSVVAKYLYYCALTIKFDFYSTSTAVPSMTQEDLGNIVFAVPMFEEQQTIARFLDAQTAKLDTLVAKKRALIEKLKEKRSALIARTVTRGLPPAAAQAAGLEPHPAMKAPGAEWLGEIPAHWDVKRLGFLCKKIGSGKTPLGGAETYVDEGIVFIRSQNVYDDGLVLEDVVYISEEVDADMRVSRIKPGDVLLNVTGASIGRSCIVPDDFPAGNVNQHVCIIRLRDLTQSHFVSWVMKAPFIKAQIDAIQSGAAREGLNFDQISKFACALPSNAEQQAIAAYLDRETAHIDRLIAKVEAAIERLTEYRHALITAAVTGKIDVSQYNTQRGTHHATVTLS
jgi:type I restriction enzyme S subunit